MRYEDETNENLEWQLCSWMPMDVPRGGPRERAVTSCINGSDTKGSGYLADRLVYEVTGMWQRNRVDRSTLITVKGLRSNHPWRDWTWVAEETGMSLEEKTESKIGGARKRPSQSRRSDGPAGELCTSRAIRMQNGPRTSLVVAFSSVYA